MVNKVVKTVFLCFACILLAVTLISCTKQENQDIAVPTTVIDTIAATDETHQTKPSDPYELERDDTVYPPVTMPDSSVDATEESAAVKGTEATVSIGEQITVESPMREDETERD